MTIREEKIERYEEALFTLWADEVAVREGRDLERENAALRLDANFRVPEEVVRRGRELISRKLAARTARSVGHHAWRLVHAAALVCLFSMLAFSAAFAASPAFRANTLNLVIETFDEGTDFRFSPIQESQDFTVGWLPEKFVISGEQQNGLITQKEYTSTLDDSFIIMSKIAGPSTNHTLDTEDAILEDTLINEKSAVIITKGNDTQLLIVNKEDSCFMQIISSGVSKSDIIHIAENIIF
ncbi:hypothetical protein CE91St43_26630 [Oscillospiraceae bacterium]|nr:hypothetical protein CE91St43_26630 [Oscillospiraceae bacterium]